MRSQPALTPTSDRRRLRQGLFWGVGLALALAGNTRSGPPATVDFSRDILPILSDNCFLCHGPDSGTRKAGLRLDIPEGALRAEHPVIVPGQSAESELFLRIRSDDALEVMPPPKSKRTL